MTTDRVFMEKYDALQNQWRKFAIEERQRHYLRYLPPRGPVDFVLVAKMTSIGKKESVGLPPSELPFIEPHYNLLISVGDLSLNYGAYRYLCDSGETYYLTDLGKCAIPPNDARGKLQEDEFNFWYPKLLVELELVAKPKATVIPVGRATWNFLRKQQKQRGFPYRLVGPVLHWGKQTVGAAQMASTLFPEEWEKYLHTSGSEDLVKSTEEIFARAGLIQYTDEVSQRIKRDFRDRDRHYMFTYKKQMPLLRPDVRR